MVIVQMRISMTQMDTVNGHIELDLLKREDATDLEWAIAKATEGAYKSIMADIVQPLCKEFKMKEI